MAGFDWTSFATAFMNTTAEGIKKNKDEANTWRLGQEELALKNTSEFQKRKTRVDTVLGYTNYLTQNGATDDQIQAAISTGPDGIVKFTEAMEKAVKLNGGRPLAKNEVSTLISMPENFRGVDKDITSFVNESFGLNAPSAGPSEMPKVSLFDRMMGNRARDLARGRLDQTVMYQGMTALDLNEMAQSAEYSSLIPGTMASFTSNLIDPSVIENVSTTLNSLTAKVKVSPEYVALNDRREEFMKAIKAQVDVEKNTAAIAEIDAQMRGMLSNNAGPAMDMYINTYGPKLFETVGGLLAQNFGQDWVDSRMKGEKTEEVPVDPALTAAKISSGPTVVEPIVAAAPTVVDATLTEGLTLSGGTVVDGGEDKVNNEKAAIVSHPSIAGGEELEIISDRDTGEVKSVTLSDGTAVKSEDIPKLTAMLGKIAEEGNAKTKAVVVETAPAREGWSIGLDYKEAPTEDYYVATIGGMYGNKEFKVSAEQLKYFPDYNIETGNVRLRKFEKGESISDMPMKSSDNLGYIFRHSPPTGEVPDVVKDKPTPLGGIKPKDRPEGSRFRNDPIVEREVEYSTAMTELVKQFGGDIETAIVKSKAKSYADIRKELFKWADKNNKVLPADIEPYVAELKAALDAARSEG